MQVLNAETQNMQIGVYIDLLLECTKGGVNVASVLGLKKKRFYSFLIM